MSKIVTHNGVEFRLDVHTWSPRILISADARVISLTEDENRWRNIGYFRVDKDGEE